ncbi:MAG: putative transport system permease protein [Actinomycetota bacterium]|nr:putative transport system permease protein [Actinomycetota bacterium]
MKAAIGLWVRNEVTRRWKALVALGLLAGLVGGLGIAAVAGARRTATAYERFREATGRADAIVFATLLGMSADYTEVRQLPEVLDAGEFTLTNGGVEDQPSLGALPPNDDRLYRTIAHPLLVTGRLPDPSREDEVVVNRQAVAQLGLGVGDHLRIVTGLDLFHNGPPFDGPAVDVTVVGVGDSVMDLLFFGDEPDVVTSAAFLARHPEIPRAGNLVVRLRPGTDVSAFAERAAAALGVPSVPVRDLREDSKRITHGTDLERTALLLFAAAVALAGLVLVGQALSRTVYGLATPASALRALGFTRNGLVAGLVLPLGVAAAAGAVTSIGIAIVLSRWFPVGLAGRLEPDRGLHADWLVAVPGAAVVAVAVLAGAAVSALRATSASSRRRSIGNRLSLVPALRRVAVAPLPAVIGAALALERGDGDRALPVRPALVGAVAAVLGVVGAFGLLHGIDGALARPDLSGQFWDADVVPNDDLPLGQIVAGATADEDVAEVGTVRLADVELEGVSAPIYAQTVVKGAPTFTLLDGRRPVAPDEIAVGPATARALHRGVGDTVRAPDGRTLRIVGTGLLPQTPHFSFDQGAWLSLDGFEAIAPPAGDEAREETVVIGFVDGISPEKGIEGLHQRLGPAAEIESSALPQDVEYLRNVRTLPKALAAFLVLLGLGALGHVLASAVRRRRHDLAVLRAIGFRPVQVAACVAWQAVTVSLVALLVGIPLGIAVGHWSWHWVADNTPIRYIPPVAAAVVLLSIPAALILANLMAALPARRAARLRPADVLRAE